MDGKKVRKDESNLHILPLPVQSVLLILDVTFEACHHHLLPYS
jgi:hypothetical protein